MEGGENRENQDPYAILKDRISSDPDFDRMYAKVKTASEAPVQAPTSQPETRNRGVGRRGFLTGAVKLGLRTAPLLIGGAAYGASRLVEPQATQAPLTELNPKPEKRVNLFNEFIRPFVEEATRKRQARIAQEGEASFYHRIDKELNQPRIQFLVYAYGEEKQYQPDGSFKIDPYENFSGSISILSLDLSSGTISQIDVSRDVRLANARRVNERGEPLSMREVFKEGAMQPNGATNRQEGIDFTRQVTEEMTGLSMDFSVVLKDTAVRDFIEMVTGPIEVDVEKDHQTQSYRLDRREYPEGEIKKGKQWMISNTAMRYMMAKEKQPKGKADERSFRKRKIFRGIRDKLTREVLSNPLNIPAILTKINDYMESQTRNGNIVLDFDPNLLGRWLMGLRNVAEKIAFNLGNVDTTIPVPDEKKNIVFSDEEYGDGGVTRVHKIRDQEDENRKDHIDIRHEADEGKMPDWMLVPNGGNPYAEDLVKEYWASTRKMVKDKLSKAA